MKMEVGASFQTFGRTPMLPAKLFTPCMSQGACLPTIPFTRGACSGCCGINWQTVRGSHRHAPCRFSCTRLRASQTAGINSFRMPGGAGQRWHSSLRFQTSLTRAIDLVFHVAGRADALPSTSEQSFPSRLLAQATDELCESPVVGFVPQ